MLTAIGRLSQAAPAARAPCDVCGGRVWSGGRLTDVVDGLADERYRAAVAVPEAGVGRGRPGSWRSAGESGMHTIVVFARRPRHEAVLGAGSPTRWAAGKRCWCYAPQGRMPRCSPLARGGGSRPERCGRSGQVEMLDSARWRAESGGRAERLYELYLGQVRRAGRDGFPGVAMTGDERAMRALVRDDVELIAHERDIDRLVADQGVRALCRYPARDVGGVLQEILRLHYRDVVDDLWQATVAADRLLVRGEIKPATSIGSSGRARGRDRGRIDSGPVRGGVLLRGGRARSVRRGRLAPPAR